MLRSQLKDRGTIRVENRGATQIQKAWDTHGTRNQEKLNDPAPLYVSWFGSKNQCLKKPDSRTRRLDRKCHYDHECIVEHPTVEIPESNIQIFIDIDDIIAVCLTMLATGFPALYSCIAHRRIPRNQDSGKLLSMF